MNSHEKQPSLLLPVLLPALCVAFGPIADRLLRHRGLSVLPRAGAVGLLVGSFCLIAYLAVGRRGGGGTSAAPRRPLAAALWAALAVALVVVVLEAVGY